MRLQSSHFSVAKLSVRRITLMYGYIYKTTNLVNGKIYIGQKHSEKFMKSYLGSGRRFKDAVKHYGKNNFKVELLEEIQLKDEMDEREIYWISFYKSTDKNVGYNISNGGNVNRAMSGEHNPFYDKTHDDEVKQHLSQVHKGRHRKPCTEETKRKISEALKGRVVSESVRDKLRENAKNNSNYGMRGKTVSNETKLKLSLSKKNKPSKARGKIHITNDVEDKMIYEDELRCYLELRWRRGRKKFSKDACDNISKGHKGLLPHNKNKKWINKNGVRRFVSVSELNEYLSKGWNIGMSEE